MHNATDPWLLIGTKKRDKNIENLKGIKYVVSKFFQKKSQSVIPEYPKHLLINIHNIFPVNY